MAHDHHHHHHHADGTGDGKLWIAVAVNMALTLAQIVGGVLSGSLAMIADALHNFSDAISLIIAFWARRIARRPADDRMTFGYGRAEIVAALINYTTLIVIGVYLAFEAVLRFFDPIEVNGWLVVVIAAVALVVDLVTAALTYSMAKDSVNIRAAFLHNLADAMGSVVVIVAGAAIMLYGWRWVDPVATLAIAGYILWMAFSEIGGVIRILMLGRPPELAPDAVLAAVEAMDGVAGVHHAHLWQMDEHRSAMQAHVVIAEGHWTRADTIKAQLKAHLSTAFGIHHLSLEMESERNACVRPAQYGS